MTRRRWMVAGAAGLTLALALGGVSLARTSSGAGEREDRAKYAQLFEQRLAERLGVSASALTEARKAAIEDVIDQAVKDGALSEEKAAAWREKLASGTLPGFGFGFGFGKAGKHGADRAFAGKEALRAARNAALDHLGMTAEEFKAAKRAGKTLEQIASEKGTTLAAVGKAAADAAEPALDDLVAAGKISRERADALLEKLRAGTFFGMGGAKKRAA